MINQNYKFNQIVYTNIDGDSMQIESVCKIKGEDNEVRNRNNLVSGLFIAFLLLILFMIPVNCYAEDANKQVLVLNSNLSVKRYSIMQNEFKNKFGKKIVEIDLSSKWQDHRLLENKIKKVKPDVIFCIGSKAYIQAKKLAEKKTPKIFSLGINWQSMSLDKHTYVVASEVPVTTQFMMFRYFFPEIKTIGVLYSKVNNKQRFNRAVSGAKDMEIKIIGKAVKNNNEMEKALKVLLPKIDALWLVLDPKVLSVRKDVDKIFGLCNDYGKPIFAYEKIFASFGATFVVSTDNQTMARQAAWIATNLVKGNDVSEKVQDPAGSHIVLNLGNIEKYGIKLNNKALGSVNELIE